MSFESVVFEECRLDDIAEIFNYKRRPLNSRERESKKGPYPYYGASGIVDYLDDFLFDGEYVLISEDGENLRTRQTPIAFKADGKFWVNNHAHIVKGKEEFMNDYLVYFFQNLNLNAYITGAVQPKLNKENLLNIPILLPKKREDRLKITLTLKSLDDKIALNRQMNQTLEDMARAVFREWFVHFNYPGADGVMENGLPEGWRMGTLGEVCEPVRSSVHPKDVEDGTPYVGLEHIPRKSLTLTEWGASEDVDSQKTRFCKGDILFGKLRPYFHKVAIAPLDGICSTDILVFRPLIKSHYSFVLNHLFSENLITYVSGIADGTRMPRVDWRSVANYQIVIPPGDLIIEFDKTVRPFYTKLVESIFETQTLATLRASLLPKLMKGEITV